MSMDCRFRFVSHAVAGILFSFAMLCWAGNAAAQASRVAATVEGTVRDTSGGAIPGAGVLLRNTSTSQSRLVTTDEQGFFRAEQLPVGVLPQSFAPMRIEIRGSTKSLTLSLTERKPSTQTHFSFMGYSSAVNFPSLSESWQCTAAIEGSALL
jgi:hypothetical protein